MTNPKLGWGVCGSFCTIAQCCTAMTALADQWEIIPILSLNVQHTDTRFGSAAEVCGAIESTAGRPAIRTITEAEPLGPKMPLDAMVIAPCTGNTLAKLAQGITDTPVTMAAKAHLRSDRPLIIALASNDALSANLWNLAVLLNRKNVYFVPLRQDDPVSKPHSLVCRPELLEETLNAAREGKQLRPLFLT